jgi:hypothetical protein
MGHDDLWHKYHAKLTELGVITPLVFLHSSQANMIHETDGMYGTTPVRLEYHVGNMDWPGWVDVYMGESYIMFISMHGGYNGTVKSSVYILDARRKRYG